MWSIDSTPSADLGKVVFATSWGIAESPSFRVRVAGDSSRLSVSTTRRSAVPATGPLPDARTVTVNLRHDRPTSHVASPRMCS